MRRVVASDSSDEQEAPASVTTSGGIGVRAENGMLTTIAGVGTALGAGGPATQAGFYGTSDVAVAAEGNVYVAEAGILCSGPGANTVQRMDPNGIITTVAGTEAPGFSGGGGPLRDTQPDWWGGPEGTQEIVWAGERLPARAYSTDIESSLGISGHRTTGLFLAEVRLTDAPVEPGATPTRVREQRPIPSRAGDRPDPPIGDGKGRSFAVPDEATRLFLCFADALGFHGCPVGMGTDQGRLIVTIDVEER